MAEGVVLVLAGLARCRLLELLVDGPRTTGDLAVRCVASWRSPYRFA